MISRSPAQRRITSGSILLAILCLVLSSSPGRCQTEPQAEYFAERTFEIPFSMSPDRVFKQLLLHVSTDRKSYARVASTSKREGQFTFTAKGDGWHYFIVQVEENDGTLQPAQVNLASPSLQVYVDTVKPQASLKPVLPDSALGSVAVEWAVSDTMLELQTLRLEYRALNGPRWIPLNIRQIPRAKFTWQPSGTGPFEVRLHVSDRARNSTTATTQVTADPNAPRPRVPGATGTPANEARVIHVNKKTFKLTYKIDGNGPSGVKHVEVWQTRDTTQWARRAGEAPAVGPYEITVDKAGRYGYSLRPISGVGRGPRAPHAGDPPQVWIEVDETPPRVQLHNVVVNEGTDANTITVNWRAEDRFLRDTPITVYHGPAPEGPWTLLQGNLENTGTCKCKTEGLPFEFYLRIEAIDRAGNKGEDVSKDKVKVDLSVPNVSEVNVTIGDQSNKPPM